MGRVRDTARAMSHENVEIVRAAFEAWNAGDMDGFFGTYDPDVMWRTAEGWPEQGPFVGREAVMRFVGQLRDTWEADALDQSATSSTPPIMFS
jgi:ketosteroid isomerase-like protein